MSTHAELFEARRYAELAEALGPPRAEEDLDTVRLRARLARRGWGTLIDLTRAARRLAEAGAEDAPRFAASAARALARAGAVSSAAALVAEAAERLGDRPELALARRQLEAGRFHGEDEREWHVRTLCADGELARARAEAEALAPSLPPTSREWAFRLVADLARGERDFAGAARAFEQAFADAPHASDAPALACAGAFCLWAAGDVPAALEKLRELRETHRGSGGDGWWAHAWSSDVLDRLDADPARRDAGATWVFLGAEAPALHRRPGDLGSSALHLARDLLGLTPPPSKARPTTAHLRHDLRDAATIRAEATLESLSAALANGIVPILEEEHATETGFLVALGVEPASGLVLYHDPRRAGAILRTIEDHRARSALSGASALFVAKDAAQLAAAGLAHDARFDLVDRCDLDEHGEPPPRARVDVLAQEGIDRSPELAALHLRLGESLLGQLRAGRLAGGRMERWYAVTRERFARAEWALQLYAQALEVWGRPFEAHIAWADARAIDPWDERNTFGMARTAIRTGDRAMGERFLTRTLCLRHGHAQALAELAALRLEGSDLAGARDASGLAEELAPEERAVLTVRASVMEAEGRFDEALDRLEQVVSKHERDMVTRARCMRRLSHARRFDDAARHAEAMVRLDPADAYNWADLGWISTVRGDGEAAMDALLTGLSRCGPSPVIVEQVGRTFGTLLDADARARAREALERLVASRPLAILDVSVEAARRGIDDDAVELALAGERMMARDANGPWRAAQTLLSLPDAEGRRAQIVALLEATIALADRYPHPRVVLAQLTMAEDAEKALALLSEAEVGVSPALVWWTLARVQTALGHADEAQRATERLRELGADALRDAACFLRNVHRFEAAHALFEEALSRAPNDAFSLQDYARSLARSGDWDGAAAKLDALEAGGGRNDPVFASFVAAGRGDWARVVALAAPEVERVMRLSEGGCYDIWPMRGRLAGARLALGDPADADALREAGASHPDALAGLVAVERAIGDPRAVEDAARLARSAPGAMITLERGGLRW